MALVLLTGFPASGKTTVSNKLRDLLQAAGQTVHIIRDGEDGIGPAPSVPSAAPRRADLYQDSTVEKRTRARLRAATERHLTGDAVVLVDSLNYIKGFRYELFCVAKTTGTRYAVVFCQQDASECLRRDAHRAQAGEDAYGPALCAALTRRYEAPVARNRWDAPLHVVDATGAAREEVLRGVIESVLGGARRLAPSRATRAPDAPGADVLGTLDRVTREVEVALVGALQAGKGVGDRLPVPGASRDVRLERKPRVAELRNMRRSYLGLARLHPPEGVPSRQKLVDEYVDYVNAQLKVAR